LIDTRLYELEGTVIMRDPSRVRVTGPLQQYAPGFEVDLARLGYKPNAAACQLQLIAHLSR